LIRWDDTLDTGHVGMDTDHKELARLFNLLREAAERPDGKESWGVVLDQIIEHARMHFHREQELMAEHHYPKIEQHAAEHAMLLDQARDYRASLEAGTTGPKIALADFPDVWLAFHILFSDKDLARFLAGTR
jgi:hemerythrin-like metal-binding protein